MRSWLLGWAACVVVYQLEVPMAPTFAPQMDAVERVAIAMCDNGELEITRTVLIADAPAGAPYVRRIAPPRGKPLPPENPDDPHQVRPSP